MPCSTSLPENTGPEEATAANHPNPQHPMAKVTEFRADVQTEITLKINEAEARALDAMFSYGANAFLEGFYKCLGKAYVQPHENGVRSLHDTIRAQLAGPLATVTECRRQMGVTLEGMRQKR